MSRLTTGHLSLIREHDKLYAARARENPWPHPLTRAEAGELKADRRNLLHHIAYLEAEIEALRKATDDPA